MTPNEKAFLDVLAVSELGRALLAASDDGYNVIVGSTAAKPILFGSYADHPRRHVHLPALGIWSTAAGRYQLLERYFDAYRRQLGLRDFGPAAQDAIALHQVRECGALPDIAAGRLREAVARCARIWASLPGAGYGQHENPFEPLRLAFQQAGGRLA